MLQVKQRRVCPRFQPMLRSAGLLDIECVAKREFDWFEAPNRRRGGWSGVSRIVLNPEAPDDERTAVFLKIQQNHFYTSWRNCFRQQLTYQREFSAINSLNDMVEGLPQILLYAEWAQGKNRGCVLITQALDGWTAFDQWLAQEPDNMDIEQVLGQLAGSLRRMHRHRWAHFGLFQKHVFLRRTMDGGFEVRLIDFEKARKTLTRNQSILEDVSRLLRHSPNLSRELQLGFLHAYFQTASFSAAQKRLIRKMRGAPDL